jgi:malonate transporter
VTAAILYKLLAIMANIALGWWAVRRGWLGSRGEGPGAGGASVAVQALGNATMYLFIPALLFRTMVRQDLSHLPLRMLAAYFLPALLFALAVYAWQRRTAVGAAAATFTVAATYGNAVQLGIPMAAALFGEQGLALHIALVSVHGLVLLTLLTALAEGDLARTQASAKRWDTFLATARNTVIHPVVLPVLLGLAWNLTGAGLHPVLDHLLHSLGLAVVPVSLLLIGASLASHGAQGRLRGAFTVSALKLLLLPAAVAAVARFGFDLHGTPLSVLVMMAALPVGVNALIFAQRYQVLAAEASVAIVVSTLAFVCTAALWLAVLAPLTR